MRRSVSSLMNTRPFAVSIRTGRVRLGSMEKGIHLRQFLFAFFALSCGQLARAADPSVIAVLTESETAVGRPVQLQIQVSGVSNPKPPGEINVDGLEIRSAGVSRQYQLNNFCLLYTSDAADERS